jgi:hypothetical protein
MEKRQDWQKDFDSRKVETQKGYREKGEKGKGGINAREE